MTLPATPGLTPLTLPAAAAPTAEVGPVELRLTARTLVVLPTAARGRELLATPDGYTAQLSAFDLSAKLQRRAPGTAADYLAHASGQVLAWTADEAAAMSRIVASVGRALAELELDLPLPPVVEVVRTTLAEEGFMTGYTRRHVVVLSAAGLRARIFAHELFHVLTRHAPPLRERAYGLLDFRIVPPIAPSADLAPRLITNPDVPVVDAVTRVRLTGDARPAWVGAILVASRAYDEGPLGHYLAPGWLVADETAAGLCPRLEGGQAVVLQPTEIGGLAARMGGNTSYDIHPEEVSADHFSLLLGGVRGLPRPDLVAGMWQILRSPDTPSPFRSPRWPT